MKKSFTIVLMTMILFVFSNSMNGQSINTVNLSPSAGNLTDCTNTAVSVDATQNCINYIYNGPGHTINGNVITITLDWSTPGPICFGALSFIQTTEQLGQLSAGTYTLDVVTILDGNIQQTNSQQITVASCCPVSSTIQGSGNSNICIGESTTLVGSATNATSAYWSQNGVNISNNATLNLQPASAGSYTYHYVATDGNCTDSTAHVLVVNNYPVINLGADTAVCVGQPVVLSAASGLAGTTYSWSSGTTSANYTATAPGTYSVIASVNGCTGSDSITIGSLSTPTFSLGNDTTLCDGSTVVLDATATTSGVTYAWSGGSTSTMPMITVNTAGNYQVTATNNIGCSFSDAITVSYQGIPMPSLGNDTTLCLGSILVLNATTNPTGVINWSTGDSDPVITVSSAGTYSVTVTTDGGCVGTDDIVVDYSTVSVNLGDTLDLVNGSPITLDAGNAGGTYLWSTGATTQTIDVDSTGSFNVIVTNTFGCTDTSAAVVIVNTTSTQSLINNFKVYPNPASQYIIVEANGTELTMARIINITGQVVGMVNIQNQEQISVEHLANGVYYLQLSNRDGKIVGQTKFIKQ